MLNVPELEIAVGVAGATTQKNSAVILVTLVVAVVIARNAIKP